MKKSYTPEEVEEIEDAAYATGFASGMMFERQRTNPESMSAEEFWEYLGDLEKE
jgi:hypothetical protein